MATFEVSMRPIEIVDTDVQVFKGTNIDLEIDVNLPDGSAYNLDNKEVQVAIRREDWPSRDLFADMAVPYQASGNTLEIHMTAEQSDKLEAPLDPTQTFPHLLQIRVDSEGFVTDLIRFHVGRKLGT